MSGIFWQWRRAHGICDATYYKWKSKYGGMEASDLKRVRELEEENAKLQRMYADMELENVAMKDLIAKKTVRPSEKRRAARYWVEQHQVSIARSCRCTGLSRSAYYRIPVHWTVR